VDTLAAGYQADVTAEQVNSYLRWPGWLDDSDWQPPALSALRHWRMAAGPGGLPAQAEGQGREVRG
jgi:hypothetical protein